MVLKVTKHFVHNEFTEGDQGRERIPHSLCCLEMGPGLSLLLTRSKQEANPPLTRVLSDPDKIFFDPKGKKLKNLTFLGEIFQIQTQTING